MLFPASEVYETAGAVAQDRAPSSVMCPLEIVLPPCWFVQNGGPCHHMPCAPFQGCLGVLGGKDRPITLLACAVALLARGRYSQGVQCYRAIRHGGERRRDPARKAWYNAGDRLDDATHDALTHGADSTAPRSAGAVSEWLKGPHWIRGVRETAPRVRIPPAPINGDRIPSPSQGEGWGEGHPDELSFQPRAPGL